MPCRWSFRLFIPNIYQYLMHHSPSQQKRHSTHERRKTQIHKRCDKIDQTYEKIWPLSILSSATAATTPRKIPMSKDRVEEVRGLGSNVLGDQEGQKPGDLEQSDTKRDTKTIHSFMTRLFLVFLSTLLAVLLAFGSYMLTWTSLQVCGISGNERHFWILPTSPPI